MTSAFTFTTKRGQFTTPVNMIILIIALVLLVAISLKLFVFTSATSVGQLCALSSVPNSAQLLNGKSFWPSYEINCQAQHNVLTKSALDMRSVTTSMTKAGGYSSAPQSGSTDLYTLQLKDEFSKQLANCWKAGGNRDLFNLKATPAVIGSATSNLPSVLSKAATFIFDYNVVVGSQQRQVAKEKLLLEKLGYMPDEFSKSDVMYTIFNSGVDFSGLSNWRSYGKKMPAVMCMVCSQTELAPSLISSLSQPVVASTSKTTTHHIENAHQIVVRDDVGNVIYKVKQSATGEWRDWSPSTFDQIVLAQSVLPTALAYPGGKIIEFYLSSDVILDTTRSIDLMLIQSITRSKTLYTSISDASLVFEIDVASITPAVELFPLPLAPYLKNIDFADKNTVKLYDVLTGKKNLHPLQVIGKSSSQSVVYYQYFETYDQPQDLSRTGTLLLNTEDVANFCDVIVNRG